MFHSKSDIDIKGSEEAKASSSFTKFNPQHIKYLWIIEKHSSKSLFYHELENVQTLDGMLLSGLLSALNSFSEAELGDSGIESIEMGGLRWVYLNNPETHLMLIAASDKQTQAPLIKARLKVIHDMFIRDFQINDEFWKKWDFEIAQFRRFSEVVETLYQQWSQADHIMNVGALFDLMGIFQQIFCIFINIVNDNFAGLKRHIVLERLHRYRDKLELWYHRQNLSDSYRVIEIFIPSIDLITDEIIFSEAPATNIFGLNPVGLNQDVLIPLFYLVLHHFQNVLQRELGERLYLSIVKKEIIPFLLQKWEILKSMELNKLLLQLFFAD
ncbi:MAG: hypothetical protein K9W44_06775 [Candidatus Lokiarchaeota archaeon]|nr:hypothetical protein [Candidatus Harpocratesius repetitus]